MTNDYPYPEENEERAYSSPPPIVQPDFSRGKDYTFLPPRAVSLAMQEFTEIHNNKSVLTWGIPQMDARINPFQRTTYTAIIGRPGMGKSYEMMRLARHHAEQLRTANPAKPPLVVYATWETSVEEFIAVYGSSYTGMSLSDIGRGGVDMVKLRGGLVSLMRNNFCVFGVSHVAARKAGVVPSLPTVLDLYAGINYLESMGHKVGVLYIDYAQAMPDERGVMDMDRVTSRVSKNILQAKSIFCISCGIPTVVGVQARREVDDYGNPKLPRIVDGQHTSVIEQAFDKVFSVTMPAKYMDLDEGFINKDADGKSWTYRINQNTRVISMLKQRYGVCEIGDRWVTEFDPVKLTVQLQSTVGEDQMDLGQNVPLQGDRSFDKSVF